MDRPLDIDARAGGKGVAALRFEVGFGGDHWRKGFRLKTVRLLGEKGEKAGSWELGVREKNVGK
jgi:hypothetical protein